MARQADSPELPGDGLLRHSIFRRNHRSYERQEPQHCHQSGVADQLLYRTFFLGRTNLVNEHSFPQCWWPDEEEYCCDDQLCLVVYWKCDR